MGTYPGQKKRSILLGAENNALVGLVAVSAIMFVIVTFIQIGYYLSNVPQNFFLTQVLNWLTLPAEPSVLLSRPWTIFTYMFTHSGVWQLISNMLWLWAFGYILQDLMGNRHLAPIFIYGGLVGAFFFLLTVNIFPVLQQQINIIRPMEGAGAGLMAVAVATTVLAPNYRIFPLLMGGIPLWVLTLIFVLIDYALIASIGAGTAVAHLSGGLIGLLYMKAVQRGADWGEWMHQLYHWFFHMFDPKKEDQQRKQKEKLHYKQGPAPFKATPKLTQQRVDELLDKISVQGYHSLSDEEKEFLKKASNESL